MNEKMVNLVKTAGCRLLQRRPDRETDPYLWIFSSTDNRHFNYNSRYLFLYVKDHCPDIRPRFVINDDVLRRKLNAQYGPDDRTPAAGKTGAGNGGRSYFIETKSAAGIRQVLHAGVWFTSAGLPVYGTGLSKGRRIINLWHGVPLKTVALSDRSESRLQKLYFKKLFSENYTDVAATSEAESRVMQRSMGVRADRMRIWGQPRCDCLFRDFDRAAFLRTIDPDLKWVPEGGKEPADGISVRHMVLYAPTFRLKEPVKLFPFSDFDRARFSDFLAEHEILLFIRMHIAETGARPFPETDRIRYLNEDRLEDIMEGLSAFDLLITDYSSIYIDYLLLDRPILFLPYDLEAYRASHGFSFPYEKVTPGEKPRTMREFQASMLRALRIPARKDTDAAGGSGGHKSAAVRPDQDPFAGERRKIRRFFYRDVSPCCARITEDVRRDAGI